MVGAAAGGPLSGCNPEQRDPRRGEAPNKSLKNNPKTHLAAQPSGFFFFGICLF